MVSYLLQVLIRGYVIIDHQRGLRIGFARVVECPVQITRHAHLLDASGKLGGVLERLFASEICGFFENKEMRTAEAEVRRARAMARIPPNHRASRVPLGVARPHGAMIGWAPLHPTATGLPVPTEEEPTVPAEPRFCLNQHAGGLILPGCFRRQVRHPRLFVNHLITPYV